MSIFRFIFAHKIQYNIKRKRDQDNNFKYVYSPVKAVIPVGYPHIKSNSEHGDEAAVSDDEHHKVVESCQKGSLWFQ